MTGDDAASLTALLRDYGGPLCEITRTPKGYRAVTRSASAPPVVFTAATVPALRELLEHGYDPAQLAAVISDFGQWQVSTSTRAQHGSRSPEATTGSSG